MLLGHQGDRDRSGERHEDRASATWTGGLRFDPHFIFGEEDLGRGGRVRFLQVDDFGGTFRLGAGTMLAENLRTRKQEAWDSHHVLQR
jgi:hypothetical protein